MRHASARHVLECAGAGHAPVVQWIEWRIPVPQIRVRFPTGVLFFASVVISLVLKCRFMVGKVPLSLFKVPLSSLRSVLYISIRSRHSEATCLMSAK